MKKAKSILIDILIFLAMIFFVFLVLNLIIKESDVSILGEMERQTMKDNTLDITALGDSLTEGIGDDSKLGGYIPYLKQSLSVAYPKIKIDIINNGKSGNRTDQLEDRIKKSKEIQKNIKNSDIILITIGGNDLTKVIKENILKGITKETFSGEYDNYTKKLKSLYKTIRKYNKNCCIYQLGIYNPFYKDFKDIKEMEEVVTEWNDLIKSTVLEYKNTEFIPIAEKIYGNEGEYISDIDSFHPNSIGYQIIANEFKSAILRDQNKWTE
jgi:lysophospholipase L1-like esterase